MDKRITFNSMPDLDVPDMLVGWDWPDAGRVGAMAIDYIVDSIGASKFASIESSAFCLRPSSTVVKGVLKNMRFVENAFYSYESNNGTKEMILFSSEQPHLHSFEYVKLILDVAKEFRVKRLITLGGITANVHHLMEPTVVSVVNDESMKRFLENADIEMSLDYSGPTSMNGLLLHEAANRGIGGMSLWSMAPAYLPNPPFQIMDFPAATKAVLQALETFLPLSLDYRDLDDRIEETNEDIGRRLDQDDEEIGNSSEDIDDDDDDEESGPIMH